MDGKLTRLNGDRWEWRTARAGFPILVEYARQRANISYGKWDQEIEERGLGTHVIAVNYGRPAGRIGDACAEIAKVNGIRVPSINLIVINETTGLPGKGADFYVQQYIDSNKLRVPDTSKITQEDKRNILKGAQEEIFDFPYWDEVLAAYGLEVPTPKPMPDRSLPAPASWHYGPESLKHRSLKALVARSPHLVGLQRSEPIGAEEKLLWSGDEVDVYFPNSALGVEIKTSDAGFDELHRGLFQCIKYRSVLRAQQIYRRSIPNADCLLGVGGILPAELREVAELLKIRFVDGLEKHLA